MSGKTDGTRSFSEVVADDPREVAALDVYRAASPVDERQPVVYFLLDGKEIVYVGQTVNLSSRVRTHQRKRGGEFDAVAYVTAPRAEVEDYEAFFINRFRPRLNKRIPEDSGLFRSSGVQPTDVSKEVEERVQEVERYPFLTPREAADVIGVSEGRLRDWRHEGRGPAYMDIRSTIRYPPRELERWRIYHEGESGA